MGFTCYSVLKHFQNTWQILEGIAVTEAPVDAESAVDH
jgi:hypothetical protein